MRNRYLTVALLILAVVLPVPLRAQTSAVFTVEENGARSKHINLVFLSEGYTLADMPAFANHVNTAVNFLFSKEPWKQYRSYCNVYRIEIASAQSGCDNGAASGAGGTRSTYFNSGFNTPSVTQLLTLDNTGNSRGYALLNKHVPEYDVPVVLVNDTKYGGAGGGIAVASVNASSAAIVEHEIGHSFALLADEYDAEYPGYTPSEKPNTTAKTARANISWNHWINAATPVPTPETSAYDSVVGLFEGSMYRISGWYRPHNNSLMRSLNRPCGSVNREQFVLQYYARVSPLEGFFPAATSRVVSGYENLEFHVTPKITGSEEALVTSWKVDGIIQPAAAGVTFTINSEILGNGVHKITSFVRDPTPFVRLDPAGVLEDEVTWDLNLSNQLPPTLTAWRSAYGENTANPAGDGLQNLVKYALGRDPAKFASPNEFPSAGVAVDGVSRYLTLTVPRRNRRADVDYVVEFSGDLKTWESGEGQDVTREDTETLLVKRDAVSLTNDGKRFARLKVRQR